MKRIFIAFCSITLIVGLVICILRFNNGSSSFVGFESFYKYSSNFEFMANIRWLINEASKDLDVFVNSDFDLDSVIAILKLCILPIRFIVLLIVDIIEGSANVLQFINYVVLS